MGTENMSETLHRVQALVLSGVYRVSQHGFRELAADDIRVEDVHAGIVDAALVEDYPDNRKEPSVLVPQHDGNGRPIHVMWACPRRPERPPYWSQPIDPRQNAGRQTS